MKKLLALTTSLIAVISASLGFGVSPAAADDAQGGINCYPQDFSKEAAFENLEDYEISEEKLLFLDSGKAYEYASERLLPLKEIPEFNGYEAKDKFSIDGFYYSFNGENVLTVYNETTTDRQPLEGFSVLKQYGGKAYAVKENALYQLNGASYEKIPLPYLDFSSVNTVYSDGAAQALKEYSKQTPLFVTLKNGAFMTEIDIDNLNGEFFSAGETYKAETDISAKTALLLATCGENGKISIVMVCGNDGKKSACYIMHSDNTSAVAREAVSPNELGATVTVDDAFIYSAPYVCKSTQLKAINSGDPLKVIGEVKKEENPELMRDFYKVEFSTENGTDVGYVPFGYVSPFTYIENDPEEKPDPNYSEEDLIKEVILVIVVIVLVLAAGGYIVFVLTSDKNKKRNKEK